MKGKETNDQHCKCVCRREFWEALLEVRNRLYRDAVLDFFAKGLPRGTGHMHELLDCIDDYLDIALREGLLDGSD